MRACGSARHLLLQRGQVSADGRDVERHFTREVGNAETAAHVQVGDRVRRVARQAQRQRHRLRLRIHDRLGLEALRAAENLEA
ncbi:hypothetical protein LP419_18635 [Massilia sp. H-1]|nr:hypothetical protein LP419_18635 [Massilia sp. H-1]